MRSVFYRCLYYYQSYLRNTMRLYFKSCFFIIRTNVWCNNILTKNILLANSPRHRHCCFPCETVIIITTSGGAERGDCAGRLRTARWKPLRIRSLPRRTDVFLFILTSVVTHSPRRSASSLPPHGNTRAIPFAVGRKQHSCYDRDRG